MASNSLAPREICIPKPAIPAPQITTSAVNALVGHVQIKDYSGEAKRGKERQGAGQGARSEGRGARGKVA